MPLNEQGMPETDAERERRFREMLARARATHREEHDGSQICLYCCLKVPTDGAEGK